MSQMRTPEQHLPYILHNPPVRENDPAPGSHTIDADFASRVVNDGDGFVGVEVRFSAVGVEPEVCEGWGAGAEGDGDLLEVLGEEAVGLSGEGGVCCYVEGGGGGKGEGWRRGDCCGWEGEGCDEDEY